MTTARPHLFQLTVRGYELDSYGHVNNAVYLQYLEQARWKLMKDNGWLTFINRDGLFLVVIDTHIRYNREAVLFDSLVVETTLKPEPPYLAFRQLIRNADTGLLVSRATVKTIFVSKERIPIDIPDFLLQPNPEQLKP
jgi:YbgC/YbaW family acyl-CoA thioester hydrolase